MALKKYLAVGLTAASIAALASCAMPSTTGSNASQSTAGSSSNNQSMGGSSAGSQAGSSAGSQAGSSTTPAEFDVSTVKKGDYTYNSFTTALGTNWNPHTWETNADSGMLGYVSMGFVDMSIKDSESGEYQWTYEMATDVKDVTASNKADLAKYGIKDTKAEKGYVFEIKLREGAKWQNGAEIKADDYIKSAQLMLDPEMKNYRANNYYGGDSAIAGARNYFYQGSVVPTENSDGNNLTFAADALVKGAAGVYTTPNGEALYIDAAKELAWLGGYTLDFYLNHFGVDTTALYAMKNEAGLIPVTDDSIAALQTAITGFGDKAEYAPHYYMYDFVYGDAEWDQVGLYKVDDYTIRYVCEKYIDINYLLTSLTSTWLVYTPLYEELTKTENGVKTTTYGTSVTTTMSYGPYKLESLQTDKQVIFTRNEEFYDYETTEDGYIYSVSDFLVDGEYKQQYQTTKYVIDVMTPENAKLAFFKGELSDYSPTASELSQYALSDQLYQADETYTMRLFFHSNLDSLKEMDKSKGNVNSVVLSNTKFRKAMSYAIDRSDFVTATPGYKPAYSIINSLYYYNVYEDPASIYRNTPEAMQSICNLYGVEYGAGKLYETLEEAYESITGYNKTMATDLFKKAFDELKADGTYTGGDIKIRIGWSAGALTADDNAAVTKLQKMINDALVGTGFGKVTLEAIGNNANRYASVANGEFAIGYGAWGGAAFYPFTMFQVYCDPDYVDLHEAGCWDPTTTMWTFTVDGKEVTMSAQAWSQSMGDGDYVDASYEVKKEILAQMEEEFLKTYYAIPLCSTTSCSLLSYKISYYTDNYNIMYGFGGSRLMSYNYTDAEWATFVQSNGGKLSYT